MSLFGSGSATIFLLLLLNFPSPSLMCDLRRLQLLLLLPLLNLPEYARVLWAYKLYNWTVTATATDRIEACCCTLQTANLIGKSAFFFFGAFSACWKGLKKREFRIAVKLATTVLKGAVVATSFSADCKKNWATFLHLFEFVWLVLLYASALMHFLCRVKIITTTTTSRSCEGEDGL